MHYTSWDRTDRDAPVLLLEAGPQELGRFTDETAAVNGSTWALAQDKDTGAHATLADGRVFRAAGDFRRDKAIAVDLAGRVFTFVNESSNNWIIDDADGTKIGQFSGGDNGVRTAVLEFEDGVALPVEEVAGLSWFVRLILEARLAKGSTALIGTLILMSVVAILAFLF